MGTKTKLKGKCWSSLSSLFSMRFSKLTLHIYKLYLQSHLEFYFQRNWEGDETMTFFDPQGLGWYETGYNWLKQYKGDTRYDRINNCFIQNPTQSFLLPAFPSGIRNAYKLSSSRSLILWNNFYLYLFILKISLMIWSKNYIQ